MSGKQANDQLDATDLVEAIGNRQRWQDAHPDLRDYWERRRSLLLTGLGADAVDDHSLPGTSSVRWILEAAALRSVQSPSPFAGVLEGTEPVIALYRQFSQAITDLDQRHHDVNQAVARACLSILSPGIEDRSCMATIFAAGGLDRMPPDPDYYE